MFKTNLLQPFPKKKKNHALKLIQNLENVKSLSKLVLHV